MVAQPYATVVLNSYSFLYCVDINFVYRSLFALEKTICRSHVHKCKTCINFHSRAAKGAYRNYETYFSVEIHDSALQG